MLNITINADETVIENTNIGARWTLKTDLFFGDVYETEKRHFKDFELYSTGDFIVKHVIDGIAGNESIEPMYIFGLREIGQTYHDLIMIIDGKSIISPKLKDIDEIRIAHRMTANYLPSSIGEKNGMRFEGLKTATEAVIAFLYYCVYNDIRLIRCKHCGKWFAPKSLKTKYCERVSPCFGIIVSGKEKLHCEQAVRNIMQKCGRIKNRIETKASAARCEKRGGNAYLYDFAEECDKLYLAAKAEPSQSNLQNYYYFLKNTEKEKGWLLPYGGSKHG